MSQTAGPHRDALVVERAYETIVLCEGGRAKAANPPDRP